MNCNACTPVLQGPICLGEFGHCADVKLPIKADQTGDHSLEYLFKGNKYLIPFQAFWNIPFIIPNKFNENSDTIFRIIQPDKTYYKQGQLYKITICPVFIIS